MTVPGGWELIVILFIVLLLFGSRKLPDLSRSIGQSIKEFRKGTADAFDDDDDATTRDTASSTERDREA
jgi:sec-independent protein translocase protein TatA